MPSIDSITERQSKFHYFAPDNILAIEGWNVRQETPELQEHIRGLAESIKAIGVQDPLTVFVGEDPKNPKGTKAFLIDGHNRFKAVCLINQEDIEAGKETTVKAIPCFVKSNMSEADRTLQMLARNSGKPLEPLEIAMVFQRLHEGFGWSIKDIARKGNVSIGDVYNKLALMNAPSELVSMIQKGVVSASLVQTVIREHGEEKATEIIKAAAEQSEIENIANGNGNGNGKAKKITKKAIDNVVKDKDDENGDNSPKKVKNSYKDAWQIACQIKEECQIILEDDDDEGEIEIRFPKILWKELQPFLRKNQ